MATLGDYIRHLQEVDKQSNKSSESNKPPISCKFCYDIGYDASGQQCTCAEQPSNTDGNKRCPDSGRICNERDCPDECLGDKDEFAGIPIPTPQGQSKEFGWPCVVVGAVCETWTATTEHVLRTTASEWDTKQHTDAGHHNDGTASTAGL